MTLEWLKNTFSTKFPKKLATAVKYTIYCQSETLGDYEIKTDEDVEKILVGDTVTFKIQEKKSSSGGPIARWFWLEDGPMW